ncbi:chemotaxis response regulator protein-glutamate methylesterase [Maridesulfovibrio salexigens]|uniref:Protein-glutamate methylesterase/protein-glutamine glutaminase n=1 Tax=Maridesulfovibrio salexigens (strain ATCC 14822 / DSM 2638 / NCIMB 8403 / VKM B-1763) TaxID=526222 RepID=C6BU35_MARSD|nr:chemotaxis response regulator protein-glutamate methylesterase [Maridesulfovibrio salexigens]ACS81744.1 response regulator receiver modulated CheB methylesterase [Maridesulfovibrio salexigens DSM 2638]
MRIGIVNDQASAVDILKKVIVDAGHEVAWIAHNGERAVEKCCADVPDLVFMDLVMPVLDGAGATQEIMQKCPCPVLIVTTSIEDNSTKVFEAMGAGALDVVSTPRQENGSITGGKELLAKISVIGKLHGSKHVRAASKSAPKVRMVPPLLAIGSSTGGPSALATLLGALPEDFPAAIAIAQHVDGNFSENLAQWLDSQTGLKVELARSGMPMQAGKVVIAPGDRHMRMGPGGIVELSRGPGENIYVPSVDVLFESLCCAGFPSNSAAVLLTGMGADGARGMFDLRNSGWMTVAQDKESSVVWGMPGAAVKMGAAREVCSIEDMAGLLVRHFKKRFRS